MRICWPYSAASAALSTMRTRSAALQNNEQDWWENPSNDLMPLLRKDPRIKVATQDPAGSDQMMRPNHLRPPFNKPAVRRAFMWAIDQAEFMQAIVGNDAKMHYTPLGMFCPDTPLFIPYSLLDRLDLAKSLICLSPQELD